MNPSPTVILLGGPNGAGKSTCAAVLLPDSVPFLNADEIAKPLPNYPSSAAEVEAGRILLRGMDEFSMQRADFAVESTLSSRSLAGRIQRLQSAGYCVTMTYIWLPDVELSLARVAERVRNGGHSIPEAVIRRRYKASLKNFFDLFLPIADVWEVYMNTAYRRPYRIAAGVKNGEPEIYHQAIWENILREKPLE